MEDLNTLAADCVVICCCCCQCLILKILIFALFRLPAKLAKRTSDFAKRKLNRRRRRRMRSGEIGNCSYSDEIVRIKEEEICVRVRAEKQIGFGNEDNDAQKCIEEVEKVMMELYDKGELGFGSFRSRGRVREESGCSVSTIDLSIVNRIEDEDGDEHSVNYQVIQMAAGSFRKT